MVKILKIISMFMYLKYLKNIIFNSEDSCRIHKHYAYDILWLTRGQSSNIIQFDFFSSHLKLDIALVFLFIKASISS